MKLSFFESRTNPMSGFMFSERNNTVLMPYWIIGTLRRCSKPRTVTLLETQISPERPKTNLFRSRGKKKSVKKLFRFRELEQLLSDDSPEEKIHPGHFF